MKQSRISSLIEAAMNILVGFVIALFSQMMIFPLVGIHGVSLSTNLEIGAYFTVISLARSYVIRRWFNSNMKDTTGTQPKGVTNEQHKS